LPLLNRCRTDLSHLASRLERTDVELLRARPGILRRVARLEDRDFTNQFTAMASRKPGLVRALTLMGILRGRLCGAHIVGRGRLGRIRSIHFARWVLLDGRNRGVFFSH